ncbi:hypothetical protein DL769_002127 [Monosporascus sp. CRB-8-3]|nr:hypothetical protein DL769_002127 [Monosporascus sp. CRB-8-3]
MSEDKGRTAAAATEKGLSPLNDTSAAPYSVFTEKQKRWIVFLAALAGMFSPMSSFIFYPAITSLATSLNVTVGLVNLAITTYMVVSGITPAILGNAADKIGRRPVYVLALTVYLLANIGLALQNDFAALLVLRMMQSAGSSGDLRPTPPGDFPIEFTRLRSSFYLVGVTTAATISYGWVVEKQVHVAIPLILQAMTGFSISAVFVALGTLLTDLNPDKPSTAAASANIVRCVLAAASLAALQPIINATARLLKWIEGGQATVTRPHSTIRDIKLYKIAVEAMQRLIDQKHEAVLVTSELTERSWLSAVFLYAYACFRRVRGIKCAAVFCKMRYRSRDDTSSLEAGLRSNGPGISELLPQLDGTIATYDTALEVISMLHKGIGRDLLLIVDRADLITGEEDLTQEGRFCRLLYTLTRANLGFKYWLNFNNADIHQRRLQHVRQKQTGKPSRKETRYRYFEASYSKDGGLSTLVCWHQDPYEPRNW